MKKVSYGILILAITAGLSGLLGACSSSKTEGEADAGGEEIPLLTDAATDAIPAENPEQPVADAASENTEAPKTDDAALAQSEPTAPPPTEQTPTQPSPQDTSSTMGGEFENYSVQRGDTLMKIAFDTYGDLYKWRSIYDSNRDRLSNPNDIPVGTVLKLEKPSQPSDLARNGEKYMIKKGDTLVKISDDIYGTTRKWRKLWENNKPLIRDPNKIFAGFHLYYAMTAEEREEAERLKRGGQATPAPLAHESQPETNGDAQQREPAEATATTPNEAAAAPDGQQTH